MEPPQDTKTNYSLLHNIYANDFKSISSNDFKKISEELNRVGDNKNLKEFLAYIKCNKYDFDPPNTDVECLYDDISTEFDTDCCLNTDVMLYIYNDCPNMLSTYELDLQSIIASIIYSCENYSTLCFDFLLEKYTINDNDNSIIIVSCNNVTLMKNKKFNFDYDKLTVYDIHTLGCENIMVCGFENTMFRACERGHTEIVKFMIEHECTSVIDDNCIHIACENGFENTVKLLIENGAKIEGCLKYACESGNLNLVKYLIEQKHVNEEYDLSLNYSCRYGHVDVVKYLIENGANIDKSFGMIEACKNGYEDIVKILIDNGGDVNIYFDSGEKLYYPIVYASAYGYNNVVNLLIENNADVSGCDDNALFIAIENVHVKLIKLLLLKKLGDIDKKQNVFSYIHPPK